MKYAVMPAWTKMAIGTPSRKAGFNVLWRNSLIAIYAPNAPPIQTSVNNVFSEIRHAFAFARRLSTKNVIKARKLVTM